MVTERCRLGPLRTFTGPVQILLRETVQVDREVRILGNPGEGGRPWRVVS